MSVTSAVVGVPAPDATSVMLSASARGIAWTRHERTVAHLDVHHQRVEPCSQLLGQDRRRDERDALDGGGHVAHAVEPLVGGCQVGGLADDRATHLADHPSELGHRGRGPVPGDALELVVRTAGVAESATRDHRHEPTAGGNHRTEHEADGVADTARRVLVEHRAVEMPRQLRAAGGHRPRRVPPARPRPCPAGTPPSRTRPPGPRQPHQR